MAPWGIGCSVEEPCTSATTCSVVSIDTNDAMRTIVFARERGVHLGPVLAHEAPHGGP